MITLKKQFVLQINNIYNGKEIFTLKDLETIERKYQKLLSSNCGVFSESQLEFIRLFYIRKFEILENLERFQNLEEAIYQFNELSEFRTDWAIWENSKETFDYLKTTNSKEELEEMTLTHYYDKTKKWFVLSYGSYAYSMNDEQIIEHMLECLESFEENILG